ncbi:MAG: alpha/beta hydrolase [Thermomicrobiales bacterium]|nr:alpha/beta hydrolase [Thermomicrobiales bacterium]
MRIRTESVTLNGQRNVVLDAYIIEQSLTAQIGHISSPTSRPAMIICPGGGYRILADRERLPAAMPFMEQGYQSFVLSYSIGDDSVYPHPLVDLSMAVRWVRANAERLGVNPDQVAIMGFSAGGHCAAMLATQWHLDTWKEAESIDIARANLGDLGSYSNQPNAAVLCYAITDFHAFPNIDERTAETVGAIAVQRIPESDPVNYISAETCPTFLWHTAADETVPALQSVRFAERLLEAGVPVELHLYERGPHGISAGNKLTDYGIEDAIPATVPGWANLAVLWVNATLGY